MDPNQGRQLADLLTQLDDDVLLQWALLEHGDVRSERGQAVLIEMKRRDLGRLALAVGMRTTLVDGGCPTEGCTGDVRYPAPGRGHREGCTYPVGAPLA